MIEVDPHAVLLIDVGHVYWQTWHATDSAVTAYESTYERIMGCQRVWSHVIVCADSPRNWRHDLCETYKANRKPKPESATQGLTDVLERVKANGVAVAYAEGYEADDVIATLVAQCWAHRVVIMSDDKDLAQLVSDDVRLWCNRHPYERGPREVEAKYGVPPSQIRDLLAIWGDSSDNIKCGCPKVGQQLGQVLLERFGSLDSLYASLDLYKKEVELADVTCASAPECPLDGIPGIGPAIKSNLLAWDRSLAVSLVSLKTDAPVSLDALLQKRPKEEPCQNDSKYLW